MIADSAGGQALILHHWTLEDRCRSITQDGWRATADVAEEGMELGVWFCD
jgi:hypothetical protein